MRFSPHLISSALVDAWGFSYQGLLVIIHNFIKYLLPTPMTDDSFYSLQKREVKQVHMSEQKPTVVISPLPHPPHLVTKSHQFYLLNCSQVPSCPSCSLALAEALDISHLNGYSRS